MRRFERGQALFETALMLPIMLFTMFAMFLAISLGAISERAELGVRYTGQLTAVNDPYNQTSLYAMYGSIDGADPSTNASCVGSSANATFLTANRKQFFQPLSGTTTTTCYDERGIVFPLYPMYLVIYHQDYIQLQTSVAVNGFLKTALGGATSETTTASLNFERPASIGDLMACTYTGQAVKASLEPTATGLLPVLNYRTGGAIPGNSTTTPFPTTLPFVFTMPFPYICTMATTPSASAGFSGQAPLQTPPPV